MNSFLSQIEPSGTMRQTGNDSNALLSENRSQFDRLLLDEISTGALLLSPEGAVLESNRAATLLLGLPAGELAGQPLAASIPNLDPEMQRSLRAAIARAASERSQCDLKFQAPGAVGTVVLDFRFRSLKAHGWPNPPILAEVFDVASETCQHLRGEDTFEHRRLDDARFRLAAIVESSDDAIASKDLKGTVTSWNCAAERLFGFTAEEMIGQPITKIIPPELLADETRILATIARGERIDHFETIRLRKDGGTVDVSLTVSPVRNENGRIIGAAKIARDITQQKRAEGALRTSERLASVGRLAATVAHEINNPLEAVINLIFLARNGRSKEEIQKYLSMVEEELDRIAHLTRQTLGFYRETKGIARVRLGEIAESLLSVFAPRMRSKGIRVSSEIDDDFEVLAVPGEIRQVIANLVSNSIDALDAGGEIHLRVSQAERWNKGRRIPGVRLTIADSGPGIPPEIRPRLFEPFFTTKRDVGTGLGLWICKSIVENHAGSIQVHSSTGPGKSGTTFSVFLPASAESSGGQAELRKAS